MIGNTVESPPPPSGSPLPAALFEVLRRSFTPRQLRYILAALTPGELAVIADPGADALIISRIKRMPGRRLKRFDDLVPADFHQQCCYRSLQLQWLRDEEYLLGTRLGRRPTEKELFIDFMNHGNGLRFRAYFALKFPEHVRLKRDCPSGRQGTPPTRVAD